MDTKAAQRQLVGLITQHLSESIPVTRILTYKPDKNGSVTGKFESLNRVFNFVFSGVDAKYKPAMNADSALFSEYFLQRFDAAPKTPRGTRALPKCTSKSYSCKGNKGVACITLTNNCRMANTAIGNERLKKIKGLAQFLASNGDDASKVEATRAKIVEGRMALAAENRAKRTPKKTEKVVAKVEPVKAKKTLDISAFKSQSDKLKSLKVKPVEKIKDFNEFKKAAFDAYGKANYEWGHDEMVPLHHLRKELEGKVSPEQFNDYIKSMKRSGEFIVNEIPASGKAFDFAQKDATPEARAGWIYNKETNSYITEVGNAKEAKKWQAQPRDYSKEGARKTKDGKPIVDKKTFDDTINQAYDKLKPKDDNLVPIHELRKELGDRVTRSQFNDWLLEKHRNGTLHLHSGGSMSAAKDHLANSIYSDRLNTYYFYAERFNEDPKKKLSDQQPSNLTGEIKEWADFYQGKNVPANLGEHKSIVQMMDKFYAKKPKGEESHLTVKGVNGKTQSALIYSTSKEKGLYIEYLATAPWNLIEGDPRSEKGSGAKAIVEAVKISQKDGYNGRITLESVASAIPFYEHLGFKNVRKETRSDLGLYELSPEDAQKLLKKYGQ